MELLEWIKGKKTFGCVAAGILVSGLHAAGLISDEIATMAYGLFGFGGLAALRSAVTAEIQPVVVAAEDTKAAVENAVVIAEVRAETAEEATAAVAKLQEETKQLFLRVTPMKKR